MNEAPGFWPQGSSGTLLPMHGFVLAGGMSSRMGVDKARLEFCRRPLVEIAVAKLRELCTTVSIVGNRDDLHEFAPVVQDERVHAGPGAGLEAGLAATSCEWVMFLPVDVPLVPVELLYAWARGELEAEATRGGKLLRSCGAKLPWASYLVTANGPQPAIALMHRDCLAGLSDALDSGQRSLLDIFAAIRSEGGVVNTPEAATFSPEATPLDLEVWFSNLNTPADFAEAESWARTQDANSTHPHRKADPALRAG